MNIDAQRQTDKEDKPLTRADVERFLQEVGSPDKLDLSGRNLIEIDLMNFNLTRAKLFEANLTGADLSNATLREA